ncbi:hypothetical protein LTR62_003771 [Meristemomyces frigidus]|uniref:Uncharacterized protein n=1 Tax=Meristemomyces frigidus TaxID=1508187 RepID=A0AAN7TEJ2_9PEZI|nr:hypothetical protein LTR62_003771 [Meristemomyces frigidus]
MSSHHIAPSNYIGATIFWLYILLALTLTATVIHTLLTFRPTTQDNASQPSPRERATTRFIWLAALSFMTLSLNMPSVLVQSYGLSKPQRQNRYLPRDPVQYLELVNDLYVIPRFRGSHRSGPGDFSMDIKRTVCYDGRVLVHGGYRRQIPRLWAFLALAQILPISFVQNLFYLALLRVPTGSRKVSPRHWSTISVVVCYCLGVSAAPRFAGTAALMPLIITARLLLFVQMALVRTGTGTTDADLVRRVQRLLVAMTVMLTLRQAYVALHAYTVTEIGKALVSHPAVSSLGFDFVLSTMSFGAWMLTELPVESESVASKKNE